MRRAIFPADMRAMERTFMQRTGYPSLLLMEHAAQAVVQALLRHVAQDARVAFACGAGGNGGDGYAAARLWRQAGGEAVCVCAAPPEALSGDAAVNAGLCRALGIPLLTAEDPGALTGAAAIVDALFGTGLARPVEGVHAALIGRINASGLPVVSADIPSGVDGATGRVLGCAVQAAETVTFHRPKPGHLLFPGRALTGHLTVADIGIPPQLDDAPGPDVLEDADLRLPARAQDAHKGTCGHLLIVAGSRGMAGAAVLCAQGALRAGAGLVTAACAQEVLPVLQAQAFCAMAAALPTRDGALAPEAGGPLGELMRGKQALCVGPGLSQRPGVLEAIRAALESDLPKVIDADALNLMASSGLRPGANTVVTPHPGEAARLLGVPVGEVTDDPAGAARTLSQRLGAVVLLKGGTTVIAHDGGMAFMAQGTPALATGGSGDVLAGVLGALLCQGLEPAQAARMAALWHARAGRRAEAALGTRQVTALDVAGCL